MQAIKSIDKAEAKNAYHEIIAGYRKRVLAMKPFPKGFRAEIAKLMPELDSIRGYDRLNNTLAGRSVDLSILETAERVYASMKQKEGKQ